MDPALKHRLIGAAVLSALAIIFLPMLIVGRDKNNTAADVPLTMPGAPGGEFQTRELPLVAPTSDVPKAGVLGMDASHPAAPVPATSVAAAIGANVPAGVQPAPMASTATAAASSVPPAAPVVKPPAVGVAVPVAAIPVAAAPNAAAPNAAAPTSVAPANGMATSPAAPPLATVPPPTVATAPSTPIPAANAGGHYVVSLGTYSNAANAQSLVASLKSSQLPAYAEAVTVAGKQAMRVRIGPFGQRGDAEATRLKAQQVRKDMPASVTALDAAAPAPAVPTAPVNKPAAASEPAPTTAKPAAASVPVAITTKPVVTITAATTKPVAPPAQATASATKPPATSATKPPAAVPAAPAPAEPATPSPAASSRGYAVQVSAFRSEDEALTLRNKLRAAGFTAFSERVQAASGTLYRVRIGPEADRDTADHLRTELSAKMGLSGMVVAYP